MARKPKGLIEFENPETREKMNFLASQYPDKGTQQILDQAVNCLFQAEAENIQRNLARLMGKE